MMATGYVHPVADGEITDLRTFALLCSRAMGALVTMRDAPMNERPPRQLEPDFGYYEERLAAAQARLDELSAMTSAEREARLEAEFQARLQNAREFDEQSKLEIARVSNMRDKVAAWEGAPEGLKEFMLDQLDRSLGDGLVYSAVEHVTRRQGNEEWDRAVKAVGDAYAALEREKAMYKSRSAWLAQLWSSLPLTD